MIAALTNSSPWQTGSLIILAKMTSAIYNCLKKTKKLYYTAVKSSVLSFTLISYTFSLKAIYF